MAINSLIAQGFQPIGRDYIAIQNELAQRKDIEQRNALAASQDARAQAEHDAKIAATQKAEHDALIKQHAQQLDAAASYVLQQPPGQAKDYVSQNFPDIASQIAQASGTPWEAVTDEHVRTIAQTLRDRARASIGMTAPSKLIDVPLEGGAIGQRDPQTNALTVPYKPPEAGAPVAIVGPDGKPTYVNRAEALGKRPYERPYASGVSGAAPPSGQGLTNAADVARQIANYQLPPLGAFAMRTPWGQEVMAEVGKLNPDYNANEFASRKSAFNQFASGKLGNQVRSFNVALSHLDTLGQAAAALGNGNISAFNQLSQFFAKQTGGEAPTNFDAMKKVVGDELVKSIVGSGGGVADREEVAHTLSKANSPQQLSGVITSYQKLMAGQLGGLKRQFEHSTGRKDFESLLSPEALPYLQTHEAQGNAGPKPPTANETAAQRAARLGIK